MLINLVAMGIASGVSFRRLLAMLFAVATIIAPLAMPASRAMAAPTPSHHGDTAATGHCGETSGQESGKAADRDCCAAMCVGIAIALASPDEPPAYARLALRPSVDPFRQGYLGEIATPPPRRA